MKFRSLTRPFRVAWTAVLLAAVALLCLGVLEPARGQSLDSIERQRASDMLKVLKDDIKKNYYDSTFRGIDVDARFKTAEDKLKQATSLGQALGIIAQTLLDLNDSHTFFIPPSRPERVEYGWNMQMVGDKCYIVAVKPGSAAQAKGLKVGDEVYSVEGFKPTRKDMWKMDYYYRALSLRPGLQVVVQSPGAEPRQLGIPAKVEHGKRVLTFSEDYNDLIREAESEGQLNRHRFYNLGNVVVWKMPNFEYEPEQADSIMSEKVSERVALVLDLRGNAGGYITTLERLVGNFFDHDIKIADLKGRKEMKPILAKTRGKSIFGGKLVVLVDSKSGSAAEIFARLVQLEKRGIVIGDLTAGAVMQARAYSHEVGTMNVVLYGASITNADVIMSDGKSVEHVGVTPDELMLPSAEDMAELRDPVLARAIELAGAKIDSLRAGALFPVEWRSIR
jgi:carboxyl-terminal processing protease